MPQPSKPTGRPAAPPEPAGGRFQWLPLLAITVGLGVAIWWWRASLVTPAPDAQPQAKPSMPSVEVPSAPAEPVASAAASETLSEADAKFLEMAQQTELTSVPFGFEADSPTLAGIAAGRVAEAAVALEARAAAGDTGANAVLAQLQDCKLLERAVESVAAAADRVRGHPAAVAAMPEERRRRMRLVADVRNHHFEAGLESCRRAQFASAAIDQRLRDAAAAGDEQSLWVMGRQAANIRERMKPWAAAAMLGHVRAQYEMGMAYRGGYAGGKRHGEKERIWLELASETLPRARERLAECYFEGCEGQPPDSEKALRLLQQAALLGHPARVEQMRPVGAGEGLQAEDRFALADFRGRLNELGCYGVSGYIRISFDSWETEQLMERSLSKFVQEQVRKLAQEYWWARGSNARSILGCN